MTDRIEEDFMTGSPIARDTGKILLRVKPNT